ncbi:MAG: hypothetical protein CVV50_01495 [Spirochaetae bacterium HGW-Spirochaetae-6]|nr:MAG: hypothetical protein CVV50_01495 [Spirochaetae bacterium HGW-Spirochaetae-6]
MEIALQLVKLKEKQNFRLLLENYWKEIDPEFNQSKIFIDKYIDYIFNNKNRKLRWIIREQKAVGFLIYYEYSVLENQKGLHIAEFYVKKDCRRQGIGRAAMALLMRKNSHCFEYRLEALCTNSPAIEFWEKNHFSKWKYIFKKRLKGE